MDERVLSGTAEALRTGYTTGSCAAGAAKAGAMLCAAYIAEHSEYNPHRSTGAETAACAGAGTDAKAVRSRLLREGVLVALPEGQFLTLPVSVLEKTKPQVVCAGIVKDAGDDHDVTHGLEIQAYVQLIPDSADSGAGVVSIDGGVGVGRVTRPGLQTAVGTAAINPVPLQMIEDNVRSVLPEGYGARVEICVPGGAEVALKTFNPRLGVEGGISIIGTTGIVRPMSEDAFKASIFAELKQKRAMGTTRVILVPGKHGELYGSQALGLPESDMVHMSNFVGFALHACVKLGFEHIHILGHLGKLVKTAGGIFNTHSQVADARMDILAAHLALMGAPRALIVQVYGANTTDEAVDFVMGTGYSGVFQRLAALAQERCSGHIDGAISVDVTLYDMKKRLLGSTEAQLTHRVAQANGGAEDVDKRADLCGGVDAGACMDIAQITVVGIGPGDALYLTGQAERILASSPCVIGTRRQVDGCLQAMDGREVAAQTYSGKLSELKAVIDEGLRVHGQVVVLASGDPAYYGIGEWVDTGFPQYTRRRIAGISSGQLLFNLLGLPMHDVLMTSAHGRPPDFDVWVRLPRVCVLTDAVWTPHALAQGYIERGLDPTFHIGERLSYPDTRITTVRASEVAVRTYHLCVVIIEQNSEERA